MPRIEGDNAESRAVGSGSPPSSPWKLHVERWSGGCGAEICSRANRVCLFKGKVPCELLFCGESPGPSEDVLGKPFEGPAGHLLDQIIERAGLNRLRLGFSNLVACIPKGEDGAKFSEPADEDVKMCLPRLVELVRICDPQIIVCVGNCARDWLDPKRKGSPAAVGGKGEKFHRAIPQVAITHPAAMLRAPASARDSMVLKAVVTLKTCAEDLT